jgi:ABC-type transport system involved in multi-copper enzyme maturation permease subunit
MSFQRLRAAFDVEFRHSLRRPLFIALALFLALTAFGLSSGRMQISSGESSVGGTKAWITSEFAQTQTMTYLVLLYYAFFIAAAAGLSLLRDREVKVDVLLHSTPMTPGEYVWGRFFAVVGGFVVMMVWQGAAAAFFNHAVPNPELNEIRGPFAAASYLVPAVTIGLPFIVFYAGLSMYLGERTRSAVMVFVLPVVTLLVCGFFLWTWSPSWLDLRLNRFMQVLDPSGYRWLNETHLKVDRGVQFYNTAHVPYDGLFWLNRLWQVVVGLGALVATQRLVAKSMRGAVTEKVSRRARRAVGPAPVPAWEEATTALRALGMKSGVPSFLTSVNAVARAELRELRRQAGLYIFVPLILMQGLGNALTAVGAFDTPILLTPGITAVAVASQTGLLVCLLLMFYTVESLERERSTGFAQILYATPVRTGAFLLGKAIANSAVAGLILLAALLACGIALAVQHTVSFSLTPFLLVWGLLLVPTFLAWTAFVTAAYAVVGNRYAAYAVSLGALILTGYKALTGGMSWAGNWFLWGFIRWSDLGFFETDRVAIVLNRVMVLGLVVFFTALAVRLFARRGADAVRTMHRLAPLRLAVSGARLLPYAAVPVVACVVLVFMVHQGVDGGVAEKADKNYWAKNLKTWFDAPLPDIARVDIEVKVDPARHWLSSAGTMTLVNPLDSTLAQIPLTGGLHWKNLAWTMNGSEYQPEDSQHLFVFTPPRPLAREDSVVIGWKFDGRYPGGVTRNGGNTSEFILPSGVVLTGFSPAFMPVLGFQEQTGETEDNTTEPRRYPRDYYQGVTRGGYGATAWYRARVTLTGPEAYTLNSAGVCTSNTVQDGWRTQVWETDHPIKILNIVCGRWAVKQGEATTVFYHPAHAYNVDEMSATLDAARRWYSEWFLPYPWRELKLSEFPALAGYAQGFGTNITFSENIGFLTRNTASTDATFLVTAHEAAHQWWGNILTPANGPNGDFLSEGTAHFSTLLLFEKVKGPRGRMEFAKGIEARYNDRRRPDDERAMYDVDGKRRSDNTVIYDRGGWVFWMLYDFMGHERAMAAYRNFFQTWSANRDHPALQDFVAAMRPYAGDAAAYDAFVEQWFEDRVVPQYRVSEAKKTRSGEGWEVTGTVTNVGTGAMPVEIAATAGERWQKPADGSAAGTYAQDPAYKDARSTLTLVEGETKPFTIRCDFEPERVVVDPDVRVLQLKRKQAVATL